MVQCGAIWCIEKFDIKLYYAVQSRNSCNPLRANVTKLREAPKSSSKACLPIHEFSNLIAQARSLMAHTTKTTKWQLAPHTLSKLLMFGVQKSEAPDVSSKFIHVSHVKITMHRETPRILIVDFSLRAKLPEALKYSCGIVTFE